MEFGLPDSTCTTVRQILASYPQIEKAVLYGSRAKGNYKAGSDIDLTLFGAALDHQSSDVHRLGPGRIRHPLHR
jgi:predicted nucleotidyltransferase